MMWVVLFLFVGFSFAEINLLELEEKVKETAKEVYPLIKVPEKEIERKAQKLKPIINKNLQSAEELRKRIKREGNRIIFLESSVKEARSPVTEERRMIYVFMSSSVPEVVWKRYARYIKTAGLPAVFVLRGCIGGCKYFRPTLEFITRVLEINEENSGLAVEVQIDPRKFRKYNVTVVPCVAVEGGTSLSCGDWNLEYHLRKLGVSNDKD